ncbi:hypothetical protein H6X65_11655, partial [Actinomyces sp. AC-19-1]|nr:hypothetical protein [Actinomyces sp. 217892]
MTTTPGPVRLQGPPSSQGTAVGAPAARPPLRRPPRYPAPAPLLTGVLT